MQKIWSIFILFLSFTILWTFEISEKRIQKQPYEGYNVYRVLPKDLAQFDKLKEFLQNNPKIDMWTAVMKPNYFADLMVPREVQGALMNFTRKHNLKMIPKIKDLQKLVNIQTEENARGKMRLRHDGVIYESLNFDRYPRFSEIDEWLEFLHREYPNITEILDIGKTHENRNMHVLKVGEKSDKPKPAVWVDAGIHAREWITVTTILYFISQLTEPHRWVNSTHVKHHDVTNYLKHLDFYFLPVHNPDGYEYTHTTNRLWRKTRSIHSRSACIGVDANRNWGHSSFGMTSGSSTNPCSQVFHGQSEFSEIENQNVRDFLTAHRDSLLSYLSIHSYSQLWLLPYGHKYEHPKQYDDMIKVGNDAIEALKNVHGTQYQAGSISDLLYLASGSSLDYVHDQLKIKYSFGLELRDRGQYGFLLPADQILPTAEETWEAYKVLLDTVLHEQNITTCVN